jgi:DNA-binding NarL/FixJ family response regulator
MVDPHEPLRKELMRSVGNGAGIEIVASVADVERALVAYRRFMPDVVVMELVLPGTRGPEAIQRMVAVDPAARIVAHTTLTDSDHVLSAFDAGAIGYVIRGLPPHELVAGVHEAARGGSPLAGRAAAVLVAELRRRRRSARLTPREREVLGLIAGGMTNKAIGVRLQISEKTVKAHVTRILEALRVSDRAQAARWVQGRRRSD